MQQGGFARAVTADQSDQFPGVDMQTDLMNDFNDWMYYRLRDEYEYLTSDEAVAESIIANEYEFDEDGNWV